MAAFMTILSRFCYRSPTRPFFVAGLIFLILITWKFLVAQPDANALMMNTKQDSWKLAGKNSHPKQIHAPIQSPMKSDEERKRLVNKIHDSDDILEPDVRDKELDDANFKAEKEMEGETQDGRKVEPVQNSKQIHADMVDDLKTKLENDGLINEHSTAKKGKSFGIHTSSEVSKVKKSEEVILENKDELKNSKTKVETDNENDTEKNERPKKLKDKTEKDNVLNVNKQVITPTSIINHVEKSSEMLKAGNSPSNTVQNVVQSKTPTSHKIDTSEYPMSEYNVLLTLVKMSPNSPLARSLKKFLKSVCRHSSVTFTLHAVVDDLGKMVVNEFFKSQATGRCTKTQVIYHDVKSVVGKLKSLTKLLQSFFSYNQNSYYNDPIFFMSTALHEVFPETIRKIIMMDVDLRFMSDIKPLFDMFDNFQPTNILGIAHEQSPVYRHVLHKYRGAHRNTLIGDPPPKGNPGYNSGVVLFHLENMRNSAIYNRILAGDEIKSLSDKYSFHGHLGDQDFFTLLSVEFPELFYTIPCSWNRQLCTYWKENGYSDIFDQYANCSKPIHVYHGNCRTKIPGDDYR